MLFFSSQTPLGMPKKNGIPKSLLADIKSVKTRLSGLEKPKAILSDIGSLKSRLANLEKAHTSINKELKNISDGLKRQESTIAQLGDGALLSFQCIRDALEFLVDRSVCLLETS